MSKPKLYSSDKVIEEFYEALASEDEGYEEYTFPDLMYFMLEKRSSRTQESDIL